MNNSIFALMVIYNKNCNNSVTYKALKEIKSINIIVCDNSTKDYGNSAVVEADNNIYIDMHGNKGLSKAYNSALDRLFQEKKNGIVCMFDDDTETPLEYFSELAEISEDESWDICLPRVFNKAWMMSPCEFNKYHVRKISDLNKCDTRYLVGINSGMAIRLNLFENYRYDENLFLDFVDFNFMLDMRKRNAKIKVMATKLYQDFSVLTHDKEAAKARYKIKKKDLDYFYKNGIISKLYLFVLKLKLKIKIFLKFKDITSFLW